MSEGHVSGSACGENGDGGRSRALGAANWLHLAAAPTFAVMAFITGGLDRGVSDVLCATTGGLPLSGMGAMYALMSLFHATPWLKLMSGLRHAPRTA